MKKESRNEKSTPVVADNEPGASGASASGPLTDRQRWSASRKREVVFRMLRGESLDALSRELSVEIYRLEEWRDLAIRGIDSGLKSRKDNPLKGELDDAHKKIGDLTMEVELLRLEREKRRPFAQRRSRR